ncbi:hypothetical protein BKA64DRAFT_295259 [Cadophora sp. MPI-SDFR-AT-0126]|nr:hypothetical protein BKA64DRAFT_295259 [Leotiomycetes sp. MPI-SDFR-AT-0126]
MNPQGPSTPLLDAPKVKRDEKERKSEYRFEPDRLSKAKRAIPGIPTEASRNVPGKPLVDFFIFAEFPPEIQDKIWVAVCFQDPATISIIVEQATIKMVGHLPKFPYFLHATSGARGIGLRFYEVLTSFGAFDREPPRTNPNVQAVAPNPVFTQAGPGHVLGTAGNNANTNNGSFTYYPAAPPLGNFGANRGVSAAGGTHALDKNKIILLDAFPIIAGNIVGLCGKPCPAHPLLPMKPTRIVRPGSPGCRKFYANLSANMFKLQIGDVFQYNYPTFSLAEESSVTCAKNFLTESQRQEQVSTLLGNYAVLPAFPPLGKLPSMFQGVGNVVLNISLPPCFNVKQYSTWAAKNAKSFLSSRYVRSTICQFPNLRSLDFYIPGDHKINPFSKMVLKHWCAVAVRDSDGMTLSRSQMAVLESYMADEMMAIRKEFGNNAIADPRLLVYVPPKADRMEFDAGFVD